MIELIVGPGSWLLRGRATRGAARELKRLLLAEIAAGRPHPHTLDWSGLEEIDVAGAQVLVAFKRSGAPAHLHFGPCAPAVLTYLENCGLAGVLLES